MTNGAPYATGPEGTPQHHADTTASTPMGAGAGDTTGSDKYVQVGPSDVVFWGSGIVTAAAVASAVATYRSGSKSLLDDGINPSTRLRMIPVAVKTLMLSTLFTAGLGVGGFYALRAAGWFSHTSADLPSPAETARMIKAPRAYLKEAVQKAQQQDGALDSKPAPG